MTKTPQEEISCKLMLWEFETLFIRVLRVGLFEWTQERKNILFSLDNLSMVLQYDKVTILVFFGR